MRTIEIDVEVMNADVLDAIGKMIFFVLSAGDWWFLIAGCRRCSSLFMTLLRSLVLSIRIKNTQNCFCQRALDMKNDINWIIIIGTLKRQISTHMNTSNVYFSRFRNANCISLHSRDLAFHCLDDNKEWKSSRWKKEDFSEEKKSEQSKNELEIVMQLSVFISQLS